MNAKTVVRLFFSFSAFFAFGVIGFTLWKDPYCGNCTTVDLDRYSVNSYYQAAQVMKANPDAEVVIVGSSRGQTISPEWLSDKLGKKVINLSVAGASVESKIAFIKLAEKLTQIKEVIWLADYFEILGDSKDKKLEAMELFSERSSSLSSVVPKLLFGIDHNNFEAALAGTNKIFTPKQGWGDVAEECFLPTYKGKASPEVLNKEVDLLYFNYKTGVFAAPESDWKKEMISDFFKSHSHLKTNVIILPYHPRFWNQLSAERPRIVESQIAWSKGFQAYPVKVFNYLEGIPNDDGSSKYWDDGVHLTCYGSIDLFQAILQAGSGLN